MFDRKGCLRPTVTNFDFMANAAVTTEDDVTPTDAA